MNISSRSENRIINTKIINSKSKMVSMRKGASTSQTDQKGIDTLQYIIDKFQIIFNKDQSILNNNY